MRSGSQNITCTSCMGSRDPSTRAIAIPAASQSISGKLAVNTEQGLKASHPDWRMQVSQGASWLIRQTPPMLSQFCQHLPRLCLPISYIILPSVARSWKTECADCSTRPVVSMGPQNGSMYRCHGMDWQMPGKSPSQQQRETAHGSAKKWEYTVCLLSCPE